MAEKCPCEGGVPTGPSTHKRVIHLSTCKHSTLRDTTKPYRPRRIRRILGTRRLIEEPAPVAPMQVRERPALPRRKRDLTGEIVTDE